MVCWFIHGLNQIKSCQEAFEVSSELVRWATNVDIEIPSCWLKSPKYQLLVQCVISETVKRQHK